MPPRLSGVGGGPGQRPVPAVSWWVWEQALLFSTCFLREKEEARKERERLTDDMIASQEVQGLMDNIGEPLALQFQGQACPRQETLQMAMSSVAPPQRLLPPSLGSSALSFPEDAS